LYEQSWWPKIDMFFSSCGAGSEQKLPGQLMYGSPVSKDLNLPVQPPMTSSGLLRYRSAPSTVLGDLCEDMLPPAPGAGPPRDTGGADNVFSRFLADHHHHHNIRDDKPSPPPAHFPSAADMASQQHQHQQMMFHSQSQQQQMVDANKSGGLYRTVSSGMEAAAASNLIRQSSSPAGFLDHFRMDNGWLVSRSLSLIRPPFGTSLVAIPCLLPASSVAAGQQLLQFLLVEFRFPRDISISGCN
jgi:hypothetical protein